MGVDPKATPSFLRFLLRSPLLPFLIEGVFGSKNLFSKNWGTPLSGPRRLPVWDPLAAILDF